MSVRRHVASLSVLLLLSCGGGQKEASPTVKKQSAAQEVLRIGEIWTNVQPEKGILSPPSKISLFNNRRISEIRLSATSASETLVLEEEIELREGGSVRCRTEFHHPLGFRWGKRQGEAALELIRPPLNGARSCQGVHPDGLIVESKKRTLFVLRSDNLVAIEPLVDRRSYIPGQL